MGLSSTGINNVGTGGGTGPMRAAGGGGDTMNDDPLAVPGSGMGDGRTEADIDTDIDGPVVDLRKTKADI